MHVEIRAQAQVYLRALKGPPVARPGEPRRLAARAAPQRLPVQVKGVLVLALEIALLEKETRFVQVGLALMHAERATVAAGVAKVVHVQDLAALRDLENLFPAPYQDAVHAHELGQRPAPRRDEIGIISAVGADLDALVAQRAAL